MTCFVILFIALCVFLILHTDYKILAYDVFWYSALWIFVIGVYLTCGVDYGEYNLSEWLFVFLLLCFISFTQGRLSVRKRMNSNIHTEVDSIEVNEKRIKKIIWLGFCGVVLFLYDLYRLNGLLIFLKESGYKIEYETSIVGSIGVLLIPCLLVSGIYIIARDLIYKNKFNISGLLLLLGYSVPCIINNGRESLLFIIIAVLSVLGCKNLLNKKKSKKTLKSHFLFITIAFCIFSFIWLMIHISKDRFTDNEINVFLTEYNVSAQNLQEGEKWGEFEFLYYNILSYFSHQIPFLDFTLREYNGPYMYGMYEFNIISRRLPDFVELDYRQVYDQLQKLFSVHRVNFSGAWNTILGSFIIDFGRIGCICICYLLGIITGHIRRQLLTTHKIKYVVLTALVCLCSFSTIQLGPFYQMLIYMSFVWWFIIFKTKKS